MRRSASLNKCTYNLDYYYLYYSRTEKDLLCTDVS